MQHKYSLAAVIVIDIVLDCDPLPCVQCFFKSIVNTTTEPLNVQASSSLEMSSSHCGENQYEQNTETLPPPRGHA